MHKARAAIAFWASQGAYATFAYDALRNTLLKWHQGTAPLTMNYDLAERLITSMEGTAFTTFSFGQAGNKIKETLGGALATYTFDPTRDNTTIDSLTYLTIL